jgi:thiamine transporter
MAVALAAVLDAVSKSLPIPRLPYGGSISLRALPLFAVSLRRGPKAGVAAGVAYGILDFAIGPQYFHPVQVLLDYPVAFGGLGLAGLVRVRPGATGWRVRAAVATGVFVGTVARLAAHFASGVVFFASFAPPGQPVWVYSLVYNASYLVPEMVIAVLLLETILRHLQPVTGRVR